MPGSGVSSSRASSPEPPPLPIYNVKETPHSTLYTPDPAHFDGNAPGDGQRAIVIDNGSWQLRAGYSTDRSPRLSCPPLFSRFRDRKLNRQYTICGSDTYVDATTRQNAKSPFEGNIVINIEALENLLDYAFIKLGVPGRSDGIGMPVVMTEAICNPGYTRGRVSELLFEAYNAPLLSYGIDALFSYSHNGGKTGLVLSAAHSSSHLLPVLDGKCILPLTTRLNWGGSQSTDYLYKLLQLKYPVFPGKLASWQAEALMLDHCYVSGDYKEEVSHYLDPEVLETQDRLIQFPYTEIVATVKTEEELAKIAERKKESGRRLQEQAARMREEKLIKKEQNLEYYRSLQARAQTESKASFARLLASNDLKNEAALERTIKELDKSIRRSRAKATGEPLPESEDEEPPTFPLLDIPDAELEPEQLKQKRHQKLLKTNYEARIRAKEEKAKEAERIAAEKAADEEARNSDLTGWLKARYDARQSLKDKLDARKKLKAELGNRKSLASQMRMKSLASLASNDPSSAPSGSGTLTPRKRRRAGPDADDDDNFGANDDDWSIYRQIAPGNAVGADEESESEELTSQLTKLEAELEKYDPDWNPNPQTDDWKTSKLHHFYRGPRRHEETAQTGSQMHMNVERIRVPEVVFNPALAGVDQAGVTETALEIITSRIEEGYRQAVASDVFLTGGFTSFNGFEERVKRELRMGLPVEWELNVRKAKDPLLDAWRGAAGWWENEGRVGKVGITKEMWEECGEGYLAEHRCGNAN